MQKPPPLPEWIETYEEYESVLARLVDGAKKISNPLLDDDKRAKMMVVYDRMDRLLGDYSERMDGKWTFLTD